jgi:hypothetical protein
MKILTQKVGKMNLLKIGVKKIAGQKIWQSATTKLERF